MENTSDTKTAHTRGIATLERIIDSRAGCTEFHLDDEKNEHYFKVSEWPDNPEDVLKGAKIGQSFKYGISRREARVTRDAKGHEQLTPARTDTTIMRKIASE